MPLIILSSICRPVPATRRSRSSSWPRTLGVQSSSPPRRMSLSWMRSRQQNSLRNWSLPVLGVIENMSGMACPYCGGTIDLFGTGGGKKAAGDLGVPFLGAIPLDPAMVKASDEGRPYILRACRFPDLAGRECGHGEPDQRGREVRTPPARVSRPPGTPFFDLFCR